MKNRPESERQELRRAAQEKLARKRRRPTLQRKLCTLVEGSGVRAESYGEVIRRRARRRFASLLPVLRLFNPNARRVQARSSIIATQAVAIAKLDERKAV